MTDFDFRKPDGKALKIGILDIEASALDAQNGYIISACIKTVNERDLRGPTWSVRIDDPRNPIKQNNVLNLKELEEMDKWLVRELVKEMDKYDLIVHWYGSMYDIPFIRTRALKHRLPLPVKNFSRDLCFVARGSFRLKHNRLATWGSFLFGKSGKTFLNFTVWLGATRGYKWAIDYIDTHCVADVVETERVYKAFMPALGKLRRR